MCLRAIAVGLCAVAWSCGPVASGAAPRAPEAAPFATALATPWLAGSPRPVPYLPALGFGASGRRSDDSTHGLLGSPPPRSVILREAAVAGAAIGVGFLLDDSIKPGSGQNTAMDDIGEVIGSPFTLGAASGLVGIDGLVAHHPRTVDTAKRLLVSIAAAMATIGALKLATDRERPDHSDRNSFPSGHSGASFATATVLDRQYGGAVGWTAYGVAAFVAASRVVGNRHFFSDVMAGAAIGRLFGRIFTHPS